MRRITVLIVTLIAGVAFSSMVYAAGEERMPSGKYDRELQAGSDASGMKGKPEAVGSSAMRMSGSRSVNEIVGMEIQNRNGEEIGEIQDIKIDPGTARVNYVTISKGGVLGIGGEEGIAVPLEAFRFDEDKATLTVDQSKLDSAPKHAELSDDEFQRELESHYGIAPSWKQDRESPEHLNLDGSKKSGMKSGDKYDTMQNKEGSDRTRQDSMNLQSGEKKRDS